MNWTGIPAKDYFKVQDIIRCFIVQAFKHSQMEQIDFAYYEDAIKNEEMQLWVIYIDSFKIDGVLISKLGWFHNLKICNVMIVAGSSIKMWELFHDDVLEKWCKENEVDKVEIKTRKGIGKVLTRHGYSVSEVICSKYFEY